MWLLVAMSVHRLYPRASDEPEASPPGTGRAAAPRLVRDRVYERLLLDIVCRELAPGVTLNEDALVRAYGSGKYGIREALQRLAVEGLVTRRPRVGTLVKELSIVDLRHVFECRVLLESHCAALAVFRASARQIEAVRRAYDGVETVIAARDWRTLVLMDQAFHRELAAATGNTHLVQMVSALHNNALRFWHYGLSFRPADALLWEVEQHMRVVEALEARDADAAQQSMRRVLGDFPKSIESLLNTCLE